MTDSESGIVEVPSRHSLDETVERIEAALRAKGVMLFAVVDHGGEAAKVGLAMPPTKLLVFGSPKAGTPVMLAAPSSAIDLPLKILVREDAERGVVISYNDPVYLLRRHGLPKETLPVLASVEALAAATAA